MSTRFFLGVFEAAGGVFSFCERMPNISSLNIPLSTGSNSWTFLNDWVLVHTTGDASSSDHMVFGDWLGRHDR